MTTLSLRDINRLKHQICFGNVPAFFHAVSTAVGQAEGSFTYGFENALARLQDKKNWNLPLLGGSRDKMGEIRCEQSPRLTVYKLFNQQGFEIHCVPWMEKREVYVEMLEHPKMEFRHWHPVNMRTVFRIPQLHMFIQQYFELGDEADLALIRHVHNLSESFVRDLHTQLNVEKEFGISVKSYFDFVDKKRQSGEPLYLPKVYDHMDEYL